MADDAPSNLPARIATGGAVQPIVPQSFEEAWRIAGALSKSGMCPKGMDTQEQALVAIMAGAEIGLAPFQAVQSFAVINNRPALWGDGMLAVVRRYGVKVEERFEGEDAAIVAVCKVTRNDTGEVIERRFTMAEAKKAGLTGKQGPWTNYPTRMLQMRARSWALRDGCADMLRGLKMVEEVQDYTEVERSEPIANEYDQRPQEEIEADAPGMFLTGQAKDLVVDHYTKLFEGAEDEAALEKAMKSFRRIYWNGTTKKVSQNTFDGVEFLYEQARARVTKGATLLPWFLSFIEGCETLAQLDEWWSGQETQARFDTLADEYQAKAQAAYEEAANRLADEAQAEIDAARKQQAGANP